MELFAFCSLYFVKDDENKDAHSLTHSLNESLSFFHLQIEFRYLRLTWRVWTNTPSVRSIIRVAKLSVSIYNWSRKYGNKNYV